MLVWECPLQAWPGGSYMQSQLYRRLRQEAHKFKVSLECVSDGKLKAYGHRSGVQHFLSMGKAQGQSPVLKKWCLTRGKHLRTIHSSCLWATTILLVSAFWKQQVTLIRMATNVAILKLSHFSIAVIKHHDQTCRRVYCGLWVYSFRELVHDHHGAGEHGAVGRQA